MTAALDGRVQRRGARREFFKSALGVGALAVGGAAALGVSTAARAQAAPTDPEILNLALNLEYLEAQFYSYAATGAGLPAAQLTGTQMQGAVSTSGANPPRAVDFAGEPAIQQYAREIAADEVAHVAFLRTALGSAAVAQPAINISGDAAGAFTAAARAAGVVGAAEIFDPYASVNNFLLAAFIFEDVGVTAYKGASPLLTSNAFIDAAAGILAAEAFHAGVIRGTLYARGVQTPALRTAADRIAEARDSLDGASDLDQGVSPVQTPITSAAGTTTEAAANIVPTGADGIVFSRSSEQVHNIVYLTRAQATSGGFFPNGTNNPNAALRRSGAN